MSRFTSQCRRDFDALLSHFEARGRPEAIANLINAIEAAYAKIVSDTAANLPYPRPYPSLAQPGQYWMKQGRYWICYKIDQLGPLLLAIFYETANMPQRFDGAER